MVSKKDITKYNIQITKKVCASLGRGESWDAEQILENIKKFLLENTGERCSIYVDCEYDYSDVSINGLVIDYSRPKTEAEIEEEINAKKLVEQKKIDDQNKKKESKRIKDINNLLSKYPDLKVKFQ